MSEAWSEAEEFGTRLDDRFSVTSQVPSSGITVEPASRRPTCFRFPCMLHNKLMGLWPVIVEQEALWRDPNEKPKPAFPDSQKQRLTKLKKNK